MDISSVAFHEAPHEDMNALRNAAPVIYCESLPIPSMLVLGHAQCMQAAVDPLLTRNPMAWEYFTGNEELEYPTIAWAHSNSPLVNDSTHDAHRRLFQNAFKPSTIRRMESQIAEVVARYTGVFDNEQADVVTAFRSTALEAIASIIGLADGEIDAEFLEMAGYFLSAVDPMLPPDKKADAERGAVFLVRKTRDMVRQFKACPAENLLSDLLAAAALDDTFEEDHIVLSVLGLLAAGSHTTALVTSMMLKTFAAHPDQLEKLRNNPALLDNAVNECLRYEVVGKFLVRFAREDYTLEGVTAKKGQMVFVALGSANRDPEVFERPDDFDIERKNLGQIASFGHGMYYCTGAHIAKTILKLELQALLDKTRGPVRQLEPATWDTGNMVFRSISSLKLGFQH